MSSNCLDKLRDERDLKCRDIASFIGVHPSTYSEWEGGKIPIPTKRLIELADYFEINIDYLLRLTDTRKRIKKKTNIDLKLIGNRLRKIRKESKLSLRTLGSDLNYSFSSLASYERGEKLINSEVLISFSKLCECSIDYILLRSDEKNIGLLVVI